MGRVDALRATSRPRARELAEAWWLESIRMCELGRFTGGLSWRRVVGLLGRLLVVLPAAAATARDFECLVFVGTYTGKGSEGIYACGFDPASGESGPLALVAATENPSFLAVDPQGRFLYAVNEVNTFQGEPSGAVSVFAIQRPSGQLQLLQQVASLGRGPAHLSLDRSARYLLVANYGGGSCAVFPIGEDGRLGPHSAFVQNAGSSVDPRRQAGPHAHAIQVTTDNRVALVADLGLDKLLVFRFDDRTGSLTPGQPAYASASPGAGPRHVACAPSGKFVYLLNEMASTIAVFAYAADAAALQERQTISVLPKDFNGKSFAAEIRVDARGKYLYASNRGDDSIAVLSIHPDDGTLTPVEWVPSGGKTPRSFALDPTGKWLLAANQNSNEIVLLRVDPASGRLSSAARSWKLVSPVCVCICSSR